MNYIEKSLKNIRATSCLTDDIDRIEEYIEWLENIFKWGYGKHYDGQSQEQLRQEFIDNHKEN